ncbi:serine/threonine protein kinase [Glycomyces sp. NRRL B-16210]|uniref:serine/threonine protein kinase n=1 Tax=Glycomyces sp. NRRL B-16210 TaxID=1463821 RepID=UPI000A4DF059|nr:serine/threonine protein kinase [Glycomyces sp. NRRL B-16210]
MDARTLVAGRYRLDQPVAAGGMGEVWRGFDMLLERPIAVKILHREFQHTKRSGDRFAREAKTLAGLRGPGLVAVYDYGEDTSGPRPLRYIVMELIEGPSLAAVLAEYGPLTPDQTLRYMAAAAEALAIAHDQGVIHRDVKPANLLIEPGDQLRMVDFGISLADGEDRLTAPGGIMGTPSYVSPEQLSGWEVDGAADLYSLGAVAYECLTGRPPFSTEDPLGVVHMHLYEEPPPLPDGLPPAVAAIVMRCLEKNPKKRWPSATALAAACRTAVGTGDLVAAPPGVEPTEELVASDCRGSRSRRVVFLAMVILVLIMVGAVSMWRPWVRASADAPPEPGSAVGRSAAEPSRPSSGASPTPEDGSEASSENEVAAASSEESANSSEDAETAFDATETAAAPLASEDVLPDVRGMEALEAREYLNSLGWTEVEFASTILLNGSTAKGCEILQQNPKPDTVHAFDQPVTISYWGLHDCP